MLTVMLSRALAASEGQLRGLPSQNRRKLGGGLIWRCSRLLTAQLRACWGMLRGRQAVCQAAAHC